MSQSHNPTNTETPRRSIGRSTPGRRIRLLLAIDGLGLGGAEMVLRDLARSLDRQTFDVCICATRGLGGTVCDELIRDGFDVFTLPARPDGRVDYLTALKFRQVLQEKAIDIVHSHAMAPLLDVSAWRLTMPRLRVVHTFHYGNYPYDSWRYHLLEGLCARAADRLIAVGHDQRRRIQASYRLPKSRIDVVWNGITIEQAASNPSLRDDVKSGDRLLVGTIAKLIEQKGLDTLLEVARRCRDASLPIQFVIVGGGPLRDKLEARRAELGVEDNVVLAGWIPNAAAQALPAFDVFFQSSRWEAMSIAILEAMANGKAIVATNVGDNAQVLEDGVTGLLVDSGDVDGMFNALVRVSDPSVRGRLGDAARRRFLERFTLGHMVSTYEEIYRELAGS